jgi:hypothetical protein
LEPTWRQLAAKLVSKEHVLIARLDCTNNVEICSNNNVSECHFLIKVNLKSIILFNFEI